MLRLVQKIALGLIVVMIGITGYIIAKSSTFQTQPQVVVAKKYGSIVRLTRNGKTFCSGTVVAPNLIITAAHCVLEETFVGARLTTEDIEIRPRNNIDLSIEASPIFASPRMDSAILHGDFSDFNIRSMVTDPTSLASIREHTTEFISCGYPLNGDIFCNYTRSPKPVGFAWSVSGVLLPGMSGGPTMLTDGTVIGINIAVEGEHALISPTYNLLSSVRK